MRMLEINVPEQSHWSKIGDILMLPLMYLLQFPSLETPQRTHFWNNDKYTTSEILHLQPDLFVSMHGVVTARRRWLGWLPLFHMPIIGGWREYIVIAPRHEEVGWHVGWIPGDTIGVSQIPLDGPVRLLRGNTETAVFGINRHGDQIPLQQIGRGRVGKRSVHSHLPLL